MNDVVRLQEELKALENRARELSACLRAMTLVGSSLNVDEVLHRAIKSAMEVMNAEAAGILLLDEATGELFFKQAAGDASSTVREIRIPKGHGIAGWVAESGEPVVVADAQNDPRFFRGADDHTGFVTRSILAVPLKVRERIIGVAEALNKIGGTFTDSDLPLFTAYASLAAVAIENARMHQTLTEQEIWAREIDIARQIQTGLQGPERAIIGKLSFHALTDPARSVGGDFYDLLDLGVGRSLVVIGDVSGKGIPAAILMSNAISRIRADAARLGDPSSILTTLNEAIAATSQRGLFVTIFLAVIEDNKMTFASAGHHMPFYWHDGDIRALPKVAGPPIGILAGALFTQETILLEDGDVLLLYTDGVTEAANAGGEYFGYEPVQEILRKSSKNPAILPSRVRVAVENFEAGAEQSDDRTIAVISYGAKRPEINLSFDNLCADDLAGLRASLDSFLVEQNVGEKSRTKLILALDEACTNIIRHAYAGQGGPAEVACRKADEELHFTLTDHGCGVKPDFPVQPPVEIRPGGLGLVILQEVMDEVRYETGSAGGCILRMKKKLES